MNDRENDWSPRCGPPPDLRDSIYSLGFAEGCRDQFPDLESYRAGRDPDERIEVLWISTHDRYPHTLRVDLIETTLTRLTREMTPP